MKDKELEAYFNGVGDTFLVIQNNFYDGKGGYYLNKGEFKALRKQIMEEYRALPFSKEIKRE